MPRISATRHAADWHQLLFGYEAAVRQGVKSLAEQHRDALASHFYTQMLADDAASRLLSHEQVKSRLHQSMQRWLVNLFAAEQGEAIEAVIAQQHQIGEIHARLDVPVHLVLRGARSLKAKFLDLIAVADLDAPQRYAAAGLVTQLIDLAMEIMSQAYSSSHDRSARAQEAYRLFAVTQNVSNERERQRAALLDWENQLMFDQAVGLAAAQLPRLGASEFGLWFRHKGAHAFGGTLESDVILQAIERIDTVLLPIFDLPDPGRDEQVRRLRELREQTRSLAFHLDALFEQNSELEAGRDVLTRLLNRKYLPVVLGKEVHYAREKGGSFAVLVIDIDHFKNINDSHGHEVGDLVLQQLAGALSNNSRGGDYLFRLGGEEFLMLLVAVDAAGAARAAEKLRQRISDEVFRLPQERSLRLTISVGVAVFNGHPDYQPLLRSADAALYQAKRAGRNRVVIATDQAA